MWHTQLPCDAFPFFPPFCYLSFSELCLLWDVSDCVHYYYGMPAGVGGVSISMETVVAKGGVERGDVHGGMGKRLKGGGVGGEYYGLYVAR